MAKQIFLKTGLVLVLLMVGALLGMVLPAALAASGAQEMPGGQSSPAAADSIAAPLAPVGTGITYQGRLDNNGNPAVGVYDFAFRLFDDPLAGVQVGSTQIVDDLAVDRGFFSVELDFGQSAFGGGARYLEIGVRPGASADPYTPLTPRQELSPSPYALALPNVYTNENTGFVGIGRDFRITGNEFFGVRAPVGAGVYGGMYVETENAQGLPFYGYANAGSLRAWTYYDGETGEWKLYNGGTRLTVPNIGGLVVDKSSGASLLLNTASTGSDGVLMGDVGTDGVQIGNGGEYPTYGMYIPSPGVDVIGAWPNTTNASGEWGLYTVDNISAGNVFAQAYTLVTQVTGDQPLAPGDLAAVSGVTGPLPGGVVQVPLVQPANEATQNGVIGVVQARLEYAAAPGKEAEGEMMLSSTAGPAMPGDYVALVVYGVAQVNIEAGALIAPGARLTASSLDGAARPLQSQEINGMLVTEGAPVIGVALAAPEPGQTSIPVFVALR